MFFLIALSFACHPSAAPAQPSPAPASGTPPRILCSVFPVYQFTQNIVAGREGIQVNLMLSPTLGCPHDYLLTPQDMTRIAAADVFVINGLGLEEFLGAPLKRANPKIMVIDASAGIRELIGSKDEHDTDHGADKDEDQAESPGDHAGHHHAGPNPHVFASPALAAQMVMTIANGLSKIDPQGAPIYKKNAEACAARLRKLADDFAAAGRSLRARKIVTTHNVFDYLARQAGLQIVAVIEETPGQEPSAARMLGLIRTIRTSGAAAVFTEPQYPASVGRTIAREAGVPVAVLDPVASGPANAPLEYYEKTMRKNLETLGKTLQ